MSTETIEATLARAIAENPALEPLTNAFGPMLIARDSRRRNVSGWQGMQAPLDAESFSGGQPLLPEAGFQCPAKGLPEALLALLPVLSRCLPGLAEELSALKAAVVSGEAGSDALWAAAFDRQAAVSGVGSQSLAFVAAEAARPFLARQAQDLAPLIDGLPWTQGCCPVCGGAPHMSVLRKRRREKTSSPPTAANVICAVPAAPRSGRSSACHARPAGARNPTISWSCATRSGPLSARTPASAARPSCSAWTAPSLWPCRTLTSRPWSWRPLEAKAVAQGFRPLATHPWSGLVE